MAFTGYLKIEGIKGESRRADHEDEIDVFGVAFSAAQPSSSSTGSGRTRGRASLSDFKCSKWYDAASPYLALACMKGKSFEEIVFMARKDSGDAHLDYLNVTLGKCMISGYSMKVDGEDSAGNDMISEEISFAFETIKITYVVQADDHSAGEEHPVEYDVVAGK